MSTETPVVYVVHWLAKEINGDFVSSMIEFASLDRTKAEAYFLDKQPKEQLMNIESHMCEIKRHIVPINLDVNYIP